MTVKDIGIITSIYSLGGLVGASISGPFNGKYGRKTVALSACIPYLLGSLLMSTAQTILHLELGRFLCGLGAGVSVVVVPLYLNEISPVAQRGQFGFMSQLAINLGILLAQTCGLFFSDYGDWRYIFAVGAGLAALNAILVLATPESPKWLATAGHLRAGRRCLEYLRDSNKVDHEFESYIKPQRGTEEETLFTVTECDDENNSDSDPEAAPGLPSRGTKPVSIWKFGTARRFRRQLVSVIGLMAFQQICGVNSIVFYSVEVLAGLLPRLAPVLNCIISAITCVIVIASASIVDKHGRKVLLLTSMAGMAATAASLGYGMGVASATLTAVSATAFVASFALGLGPVPFMMVPELVASDAANAAQSIGMAVNWFSQFLVGFLFLFLQQSVGGRAYYVFSLVGIIGIVFTWCCVPETKNKTSMVEVWGRAP